jgi:hypothetical protein
MEVLKILMKKLVREKLYSKVLLGLVLVVLLGACSSKGALFTKSYDRSTLKIQQLKFDYLSIKSKIELQEPHKTTKVTALLRMRQDSLIWFNLSGALGVQGMRGLITRDSVYIINRVESQYSIYSFEDVSREFNFPIDFALIQSMIIGNMPKPNDIDQYVKRERGKYMVRQNIDEIQIDNYIDETNMKLVEVRVKEASTNNELKLLYKDFRVLNNQAFPYSAFVSLIHFNEFGQLETQMTIEHNRVEDPGKDLKFPFNIPNKYVRK